MLRVALVEKAKGGRTNLRRIADVLVSKAVSCTLSRKSSIDSKDEPAPVYRRAGQRPSAFLPRTVSAMHSPPFGYKSLGLT